MLLSRYRCVRLVACCSPPKLLIFFPDRSGVVSASISDRYIKEPAGLLSTLAIPARRFASGIKTGAITVKCTASVMPSAEASTVLLSSIVSLAVNVVSALPLASVEVAVLLSVPSSTAAVNVIGTPSKPNPFLSNTSTTSGSATDAPRVTR